MTGKHVCLPDMSYACGGSILTKEGGFVLGTGRWDQVGCEECKAFGRERLSALCQWLQGKGPHPDEKPKINLGLATLSGGIA